MRERAPVVTPIGCRREALRRAWDMTVPQANTIDDVCHALDALVARRLAELGISSPRQGV